MSLGAVSIRQTIARRPIARLRGRAAEFIGHRGRVVEQKVLAQARGRSHLD